MNMKKIRSPHLDGIFYPASAELLKGYIQSKIDESSVTPESYFGIISPHAGFDFSGSVQASAFKAISKSKPEVIYIIGAVSREHVNSIFLSESDYFETPLGLSPVQIDINEDLVSSSTQIIYNDIPHLEENSIEAQLPFVQHVFGETPIVPILMGNCQETLISILESALRLSLQNQSDAIIIASSNLSPFLDERDASATSLELTEAIEKVDTVHLNALIHSNIQLPHGTSAISVLLKLAGDDASVYKLDENSSSPNELDNRIVRYGAFAVQRQQK